MRQGKGCPDTSLSKYSELSPIRYEYLRIIKNVVENGEKERHNAVSKAFVWRYLRSSNEYKRLLTQKGCHNYDHR